MKKARSWLAILLSVALLMGGIPSWAEEADQGTEEAVLETMAAPEPTPEPTPESTPEPTLEPTKEPTPTPTPEVTEQPAAEPTLTAEPTVKPTEEPAGSSFDTAIELEFDRQASGEITREFPVVYYHMTVARTGEYQFVSSGHLSVKAVLTEGQGKTLAVFEPNVPEKDGQEPEYFACNASLEKDTDYFLAIHSAQADETGKFKLLLTSAPEETEEPAAASPTAEPIPSPTAEATALPTVEPTQALLITPVQGDKSEATQTPGKPSVAPVSMPVGILEGSPSEHGSSGPATGAKATYPESSHPYANYMNTTWYYSVANAVELYITFSTDTYVESGYDYLYICDLSGAAISFTDQNNVSYTRFTGAQLAGATIHLTGFSGFGIRLTSDYMITYYGFRVTDVRAVYLAAPVVSTCRQSSEASVLLDWGDVPGAGGYIVSRKAAGGSYVDVLAPTSSTVVDAGLTPGVTYTYKVTAFKHLDGANQYGPASSEISVRLLGTPAAPLVSAASASSISITWSSDPMAQGYRLYRSSELNGTYFQITDRTSTSYTDTGLTNDSFYYYKVAAYTSYGATSSLSGAATLLLLSVPSFTWADQTDMTSARLEWSSILNAGGYKLYRSTSLGGTYTLLGSPALTSYSDSGLTPGTAYYYKIRTVRTEGGIEYISAYSAAQAIQILAKPVFSFAAALNATSARLVWPAVAGASGYTVYSSPSEAGVYTKVTTLSASSLDLPGLTPGSLSFYKVEAYKLVNGNPVYGPLSNPAPVLMMDAPVLNSAVSSGATKARCAWSGVYGTAGYSLWRATSFDGAYQEVGTTATTTLEDQNLSPGQRYYYKVCCYMSVGGVLRYGAFSTVMSVQVLAKPAITTAEARSASKVYLKWSAVAGAGGYNLYWATSQNGKYTALKTLSGTSLEYSGLPAGKVYYFKVAAYQTVNGKKIDGTASDSQPAVALGAPTVKAPGQSAATSIALSWGKVAGASGYAVYRSTSSSSGYTQIKTLTGISFTNSGLTAGKTYYYKIRAYKTSGSTKVYGLYSPVKSAQVLAKAVISSATVASSTSVTVTWKSVSGASGYALYRATSQTGTYSLVKTLTATSCTNPGLSPGKTYYYAVAAYKTVSGKKVYGVRSDPVSVVLPSNATAKYRALLVGQSAYQYLIDLGGTYDAGNMKTMLGNLSMNGQKWSVTTRTNLTASQILSAIPSAFSGATSKDVSLFYYSGHGDDRTGSTAGALCGVECDASSGLVTPAQLRSALDKIPGTVIVILDSCGSGAAIYAKSATEKQGIVTRTQALQFNQAFISAFSSGIITKTGELRASKYLVLTACQYGDTSVELDPNDGIHDPFGVFTYALCGAGGWDIYNKKKLDLLGDSNHDSAVSLTEAYSFVRSVIAQINGVDQVAQMYPSGSTFPIFKR